jgi:hypothetical protein
MLSISTLGVFLSHDKALIGRKQYELDADCP